MGGYPLRAGKRESTSKGGSRELLSHGPRGPLLGGEGREDPARFRLNRVNHAETRKRTREVAGAAESFPLPGNSRLRGWKC